MPRGASADVGREYADALARFHDSLARRPPPGFAASRTAPVGPAPWLPDGGYEDWYLVEDFTALGVLNGAAVDPVHVGDHDVVAHLSGTGTGGLYAFIGGDSQARGASRWSQTPFDPDLPGGRWQRQLVLGPAPEWCLVTP